VATRSDPHSVSKPDEEHLRRFLKARARGDAAGMRRWWDELVVDVFDRMDGLVAATHKGRLDDEEHELAVQRALIKFSQNLVTTFAGTSMGELVNATKTLARGVCIDVQEESIRRRRRHGVSLDDDRRADGEDGPAPQGWELAEAHRRLDAEERGRDARDFLDWALPRLNDNRRRVLELTLEGVELPEICAELGIERDNAYQRRSRGLRDLSKLKEQYDT
jgi:DNA-directed RNA polymerase specialized sigma24 family protein